MTTGEEAVPVTLAQGQLTTHAGEYLGFTATETGGAAAVRAVLYDHIGSAGGSIIEEIDLAASAKDDANYPKPGRNVVNGIWCQVSGTGVLQGSAFVDRA